MEILTVGYPANWCQCSGCDVPAAMDSEIRNEDCGGDFVANIHRYWQSNFPDWMRDETGTGVVRTVP